MEDADFVILPWIFIDASTICIVDSDHQYPGEIIYISSVLLQDLDI